MGSAKACQNTENKEPAIAGFSFAFNREPIRGLSSDCIIFDEWPHPPAEEQGRPPGCRFWVAATIVFVLTNVALITYIWKFTS